ncbi:MAG: sporulation initiation factor Spo0A C-terminal domain-containing protein, partial [Firmicutes bacterium]|nr:sporulation initiation factor Spo0A C-terminal domain-containing protein [Bacillota bacterium]
VKGYQYIRTAIMMAVEDTAPLTYITKQLYPDIAKLHRTVASCVERSIRTAIELAWNRGSRSKIYEIFGCSVNNKKGKPSNSEFIAMVADHIRLNYGNLNNFPSDI